MIAIGALPAGCCLQCIMEDDRLLRNDRMAYVKDETFKVLEGFKLFTHTCWHRMATTVSREYSAHELASDVLRTAQGTLAHIDEGVFQLTQKLPLSLGVGDVDANVRNLATQPEPTEFVASRIWRLLVHKKHNVFDVVSMIRLWAEIMFSAIRIEHDHVAATIIARYHHQIGLLMLLVRTQVYLSRVFFRDPPRDRIRELHRRALAIVEKKVPQRLHGANLYLRFLLEQWSRRFADADEHTRERERVEIVSTHVTRYKQLSYPDRQQYEVDAEAEIKQKQREINLEHQKHTKKLQDHEKTVAKEQVNARPLRLSNLRFDGVELRDLTRMFDDHIAYTQRRCHELALRLLDPVRRPDMEHQRRLVARPAGDLPPRPHPFWVPPLCRARQNTLGEVVAFRDGLAADPRYYQLVKLSQNPLAASLVPLHRVPPEERARVLEDREEIMEWRLMQCNKRAKSWQTL